MTGFINHFITLHHPCFTGLYTGQSIHMVFLKTHVCVSLSIYGLRDVIKVWYHHQDDAVNLSHEKCQCDFTQKSMFMHAEFFIPLTFSAVSCCICVCWSFSRRRTKRRRRMRRKREMRSWATMWLSRPTGSVCFGGEAVRKQRKEMWETRKKTKLICYVILM